MQEASREKDSLLIWKPRLVLIYVGYRCRWKLCHWVYKELFSKFLDGEERTYLMLWMVISDSEGLDSEGTLFKEVLTLL